jgi:methanogen extracellular protein (TIGR04279 family)
MTVKQISIFLENKPGQLAGICRTLAEAGINITTLSLADTAEFGIVRMIVDDHTKGCEVLSASGFAVRETDVVTATVPNRPGGMAEITAKLDAAGADIEYSYAYALGEGDKAVLVFRFKDNAKGEFALSSV